MAAHAYKPTYVQRPERRSVEVDTTAIDGVGRMLGTRNYNVSDGGFMAECEERLPIGAQIELDVPGRGVVRAEVRWVLGWRFGAMFLDAANS